MGQKSPAEDALTPAELSELLAEKRVTVDGEPVTPDVDDDHDLAERIATTAENHQHKPVITVLAEFGLDPTAYREAVEVALALEGVDAVRALPPDQDTPEDLEAGDDANTPRENLDPPARTPGERPENYPPGQVSRRLRLPSPKIESTTAATPTSAVNLSPNPTETPPSRTTRTSREKIIRNQIRETATGRSRPTTGRPLADSRISAVT